MKDIIIYTEGSHQLGLGHIYRTLSLAHSLEKKRRQITFVTTSEKFVTDLIHTHGFDVQKPEIKSGLLEHILRLSPKIIIIDKMTVDINFTRFLKKNTSSKIVIFGNVSNANKYADVIINAIIGTDFKNKKYVDEKNTTFLEGPKYLVLRDEFNDLHNIYSPHGELRNVMMMFGGTDQANFSCKVLQQLLESDRDYSIDLVLGLGYKFQDTLDTMLRNHQNARVQISSNIQNVSEHMLKSDFFITSPGTSMFEAFYLGLPVLALYQNQSQVDVFRNFFMCRQFDDNKSISEDIEKIFSNYDRYQKQLMKIKIGMGKNEILNTILQV